MGGIFAVDVHRHVYSPDARDLGCRREIFGSFDLGGGAQIEDGGDVQVSDLLHSIGCCPTWVGASEDEAAPD